MERDGYQNLKRNKNMARNVLDVQSLMISRKRIIYGMDTDQDIPRDNKNECA